MALATAAAEEDWVYSFEAEVMVRSLRGRTQLSRCYSPSFHSIPLRTSPPFGNPLDLVISLQKKNVLHAMGFTGLAEQLHGVDIHDKKAVGKILSAASVHMYVGDSRSGVQSLFCDESGESCEGCQQLRELGKDARGSLIRRQTAKRERLDQLLLPAGQQDSERHAAVGTLTTTELLYKLQRSSGNVHGLQRSVRHGNQRAHSLEERIQQGGGIIPGCLSKLLIAARTGEHQNVCCVSTAFVAMHTSKQIK